MLQCTGENVTESGDWRKDSGDSRPEPALGLLVSDDLEISVPVESDAEELFSVIDANRDYLREWLPWLDDILSIDDEKSMIRNFWNNGDDSVIYVIRLNGAIVGVVSLNWLDWNNRSFGLGYWVSEDWSGRGIATKSCSRLIDHCFSDLGLHRSVIEASVHNIPSRAIAEKLGMRLEGISKDREWLYDHFTDSVMYAITQPEWSGKVNDELILDP